MTFFFGGTEVWSQGLGFARQTLYPWATPQYEGLFEVPDELVLDLLVKTPAQVSKMKYLKLGI
jgi:hypothetical protein